MVSKVVRHKLEPFFISSHLHTPQHTVGHSSYQKAHQTPPAPPTPFGWKLLLLDFLIFSMDNLLHSLKFLSASCI
jgi:hypothetical protein